MSLKSTININELKLVLIHGNGGGSPNDNWLPSVKNEFEKMGLIVIAKQFPDADLARESQWIPFLKDEVMADEHSILIGHSSGAIAAMRFAEKYPLFGSVLIGAYHTDLGMNSEKQSGYFNRPWSWDVIKSNQHWIIQFASTDDKWIPIEEARFIHQKLSTEYHEFTNQGHFGGDYLKLEFPELIAVIQDKLF
jgi:uncharacterized protein